MSPSRLTLAIDSGLAAVPETGMVAVMMPPVGYDLSSLPAGRTAVVSPLVTVHAHFSGLGFATAQSLPEDSALVIVILPRAKALARGLIAEAARTGAPVIVDGDKTNGVDSLYRDIRKRAEIGPAWSKAHGKLFAIPSSAEFADWAVVRGDIENGFVTAPGIFSADAIDRASRMLADALPAGLSGTAADLGAGWGYLSARAMATCDGLTELHLIEADASALDCARLNVTDPRAQFHWADATRWTPEKPLDAVIMNPPFHTGRSTDPALGRAFIDRAAGVLSPRGQLFLVANRHLAYEQTLAERFAEHTEIAGDSGFKVLSARKPRRNR